MFTRVNLLGWGTYAPVTHAEMTQLDINISRALDGVNGGTYTLAEPLVINGTVSIPGLTTGPTAVIEADVVTANSELNIPSGSVLDVASGGKVWVKGGGTLDVDGTAYVATLYAVNIYVGTGAGSGLARTWPIPVVLANAESQWSAQFSGDGTSAGETVQVAIATVAPNPELPRSILVLPVDPHCFEGEFISFAIRTAASYSGTPVIAEAAKAYLVRINADGAIDAIVGTFTDARGTSLGNYTGTKVTSTTTGLTASIAQDRRYALIVHPPKVSSGSGTVWFAVHSASVTVECRGL